MTYSDFTLYVGEDITLTVNLDFDPTAMTFQFNAYRQSGATASITKSAPVASTSSVTVSFLAADTSALDTGGLVWNVSRTDAGFSDPVAGGCLNLLRR